MRSEPTTLALVGQLIADRLRDEYDVDPAPLFAKAGLDTALLTRAGSRYPRAAVMKLWELAADATGDRLIGLRIGAKVRTTTYHALGFALLSSHTLLDALQRLARYYKIIVTVPLELSIQDDETGENTIVEVIYPDAKYPAPPIALDSFIASILKLCRTATESNMSPVRVTLGHSGNGTAEEYAEVLGCPVSFNSPRNTLVFTREQLLAPLPGDNLDAVMGNDRVVERYLEALEPDQVTTEVRRLLISLFPTGEASQQIVAQRMARSVSTLQRQLNTEGTSYREVQDEIRERLAAEYVRDGEYSLSQIAYLLGFSDQSNFSRAFKRWKGMSPKEYQAAGKAN